ncbi:hypothetical protein ACGFI4_00965 [Micromonospora carbonacea]|nr:MULTISPECIES: hypothetical protein [Micromonospora]MDG4815322.1 hypothetical protein [Micromonospora sp. WMMD956]QLD27356.1 hypothetical protein HXZ27_26710 [Micromonospora carbonacea]WFE61576.1 hypothetical protein O7633_14020 [Micromonospora sp. WMMD712]
MSVVPPQAPAPSPPGRPGWPWRLLDLALRVAGGVVAVVGAVATGLLELILSTVRVSGTLVGVSVPVAVLANVALSWFAHAAVGRRWAVVLPATPWFVLMGAAAIRTSEGDLLLAGDNWVGLAMIVAGAMTFAVMGFRQVLAPPPARRDG